MKLKACLEIGKSCDLNTVEEAIRNVILHNANLFTYEEAGSEIRQLLTEFKASGLKDEDTIMSALERIK